MVAVNNRWLAEEYSRSLVCCKERFATAIRRRRCRHRCVLLSGWLDGSLKHLGEDVRIKARPEG